MFTKANVAGLARQIGTIMSQNAEKIMDPAASLGFLLINIGVHLSR